MTKLDYGEYLLPGGCKVERNRDTLVIRESRRGAVTEPRCRDCKNFKRGYSTTSIRYMGNICEMKPKTTYKDRQIYFAANPYGKPCDMFEPK